MCSVLLLRASDSAGVCFEGQGAMHCASFYGSDLGSDELRTAFRSAAFRIVAFRNRTAGTEMHVLCVLGTTGCGAIGMQLDAFSEEAGTAGMYLLDTCMAGTLQLQLLLLSAATYPDLTPCLLPLCHPLLPSACIPTGRGAAKQ